MRKYSFLIGLLSVFLLSTAQQNNTWYFGSRAGINFSPAGIRPVPYAVHQNVMTASEGCSSICDEDGKMLFYTNGKTIYNYTGNIMQNGDNVSGHPSAFQAALVVPLPNSSTIFYVFTADAYENAFADGYRYSIVDMSLDNGRGSVIAKNILLQAPCSERLAAARHANGIDVWIITNDYSSNIFRSWLLTCTGLQPIPSVSIIGEIPDQNDYANTGSMKISPDGKYLCQTHFPDLTDSLGENYFQLFDFNRSTGMLSNAKTIRIPLTKYYASEFSPDSKFLYVTKASESGEIDQFNCTLLNAAEIIASQYTISTENNFCGIQLAPDKKIYLTLYSGKLSVIGQPDSYGPACDYINNKVDLEGNFSSLNLPTFINDMAFDPYNNFTMQIIDTCTGRIQFSGYTILTGTISWFWDFGDGTTSTLQNPQHVFADIFQFYTVKLRITSSSVCGYIVRSKTFPAGGFLMKPDFQAVNHCDSGIVHFENRSLFYPEMIGQFNWDFGDGNFSTIENPVHSYLVAGNYSVKLKMGNIAQCLNDSITKILDIQKLTIQVTPDQTVDEGATVQLNVNGGGTIFRWEPPKWLNNSSIPNPRSTPLDDIRYVVTATNDVGCSDTDTVFIKVNHKTNIFVPSAFTPNSDGLNDVIKPFLSMQYELHNFSVFNRWGEVIFTTANRNSGWDGKIKNVIQPPGLYIWFIRVTDRSGNMVERKGSFVLIR